MGDTIVAGDKVDILPGNALPLKNIPLGTMVHNVELRPGKGGQIARSAGSAVQVVAKEGKYVTLKLPSGETRLVFPECLATIGQVGNVDHENVSIGKAGRSRWARAEAARLRQRDESRRSPAGWWRGPCEGGTAPGLALGPASQRVQDSAPEAVGSFHPAAEEA